MIKHGLRGYKVLRCRCDVCRAANAAASRSWNERNPEKRRAIRTATCPDCGGTMSAGNGHAYDPERCLACTRALRAPEHGTGSRYAGGCRCDDCRAATAAYMREWRRGKRVAA